MTENRDGQPVRGIRDAYCPACKQTTEMRHLCVDGDSDVRACTECGSEVDPDLLVYAKPSEATYPDVG